MQYPSLISHAVASSAPVLAKYDFIQYLQVVTASLQTGPTGDQCTDRCARSSCNVLLTLSLLVTPGFDSLPCFTRDAVIACGSIQNATTQIQQLLSTSVGVSQLVTAFSLCEAPVTPLDIMNFVSTIAGAFMEVVQYNNVLPYNVSMVVRTARGCGLTFSRVL